MRWVNLLFGKYLRTRRLATHDMIVKVCRREKTHALGAFHLRGSIHHFLTWLKQLKFGRIDLMELYVRVAYSNIFSSAIILWSLCCPNLARYSLHIFKTVLVIYQINRGFFIITLSRGWCILLELLVLLEHIKLLVVGFLIPRLASISYSAHIRR